MKELVSHIEFLLHHHNCVIIPDFGGFVVNSSHARRDGISTFHAPSCELVFNRDLLHNDGLLAQSYMKSYQIPFEAAMAKIELAVDELKRQLRDEKQVELGDLGCFAMNDEKRFVYKPAVFVQPALFGLGTASLKPLIQMQPAGNVSHTAQRKPLYRSVGIAAAAAVVLLLLMFLLPVGEQTIARQSAQMVSESDLFGGRTQRAKREKVDQKLVVSDNKAAEVLVAEQSQATATPKMLDATLLNEPRYYIVVGVYEVKEVAEKMMENLLSEGLNETGWMQRPGRIDVYAASFTDKEAAENSLKEIHQDFPDLRDAWILKR